MQHLHTFRSFIDIDSQECQLWRAYVDNFLRHNNNVVQHHADGTRNDTPTRGITNNEYGGKRHDEKELW